MKSICVNTRLLMKGQLEGIGFHTLEVLKILTRDHPDVSFHFLFDRPYDPSFKLADNVTCHWAYPPTRHPLLIQYWFDKVLPGFLRKIKPSVFWSPDNFLSLKTKTPTVLTIHDLAYKHLSAGVPRKEQRFYEKYMPRYIDRADHILCVSQYTKEDIINLTNKDHDDITVCYNGCRADFRPLDELEKNRIRVKYADGTPYFLYLGSMHPRKNIVRLIKAYTIFRNKKGARYKLILAGRKAWMGQEIVSEIEKNPYKEDICLLEKYMDVEESAALVGASFCLMYVSLFEGFGIPILEGLHAEVPVITSNTSSMPEVGGDATLYANPESIEDISDQMIRLYASPNLKDQLAAKAKMQRQKYSWERSASIIFDVLSRY